MSSLPNFHGLVRQAQSLAAGEDLGPAQIEAAVTGLTDPAGPDAGKAAFLRALRAKGETAGEIAGFVRALLARAVDPEVDPGTLPGPMIDVCGTGGDQLHLFNVSTTVAFVLAGGGATVVKHGNRAITSKSGGADVLYALGVPLDLSPEALRRSLATAGFGFLFAPLYHPAFAAVGPVRRLLAAEGTGTIFNLLGPLLNPARPAHQLVGIFSPEMTAVYAEVLRQLGRRRAWAVHGAGGMDELSTLGATRVCWTVAAERGGEVGKREVTPEEAGLSRLGGLDVLRGGTAEENARLLVSILSGEVTGPRLELVLLNAGAGFVVAGLSEDLPTGVERARRAITDGRAMAALEKARMAGR